MSIIPIIKTHHSVHNTNVTFCLGLDWETTGKSHSELIDLLLCFVCLFVLAVSRHINKDLWGLAVHV